jgi:hypothetical protein
MKARAARLLVLCCIAALAAATAATADRAPVNPVCNGTKIDPVVDGTYALPIGQVTIHVSQTDAGPVFDFDTGDTTVVVNSVGVKGGTTLLTLTEGTSSATGVHAAPNPNSGKWYGLSYLCFDTSATSPA